MTLYSKDGNWKYIEREKKWHIIKFNLYKHPTFDNPTFDNSCLSSFNLLSQRQYFDYEELQFFPRTRYSFKGFKIPEIQYF